MKYFSTLLFSFLLFTTLSAQDYNLQLIGDYDYDYDGSDIWGYVDENGTEYAIMGIEDGTVIISLADPTNPVEVAYIDGGNSIWRDMKSYGQYAYVTTEAPDGLLVVNLSDVANGNVTHYFYQPFFNNIVTGPLQTIHNLYIDENGFCYIAGSNLNNGGVLILDLNQDPENPPLVGIGEAIYSHDVYVRNDTCWSSNVNDGHFSAIDVSDKTNPVTLAYQETTFNYTHNAWLSDSGQFIFTTDELPNANIDAYDVSDVNNIIRMDTWVPPTTAGTGVIPHNVHVYNDYLVISYYTDGVKIVDAHRPSNLVEVGSYDTYDGGSGFFGCWGAYPFLPSGLVLASDIGKGLLVLEPNYVRACYLEGQVTDANTSLPLNNVAIQVSSGLEETTPSNGEYATGQVEAGVFQVTYSKIGYVSQTVDVTLVNGEVTIQNIALVPDIPVDVTGQVIDAASGAPIAGAAVRMESDNANLQTTTDASGNFIFTGVFQNEYDIYAGKWGHSTVGEALTVTDVSNNNIILSLETGYMDPFAVDLGWTESGNATAGEWELDEPIGTFFDGALFHPELDVDGDVGNWCYTTGNNGGEAGNDDVDGGNTVLLSPTFDISDYNDAHITYQAWFMNGGGDGNPNDQLVISILNGTDEAVVETIDMNTNEWNALVEIRVADFITPTANMQFKVETSDFAGSGHLVEAGFDNFSVTDGPTFQTLTGIVQDIANGNPIADAQVRIQGESTSYNGSTDANGSFVIEGIFPDNYEIYAGIWGFSTEETSANIADGNPNTVVLELSEGYQDPFAVDLGWNILGTANSGVWELGDPIGTTYNGSEFAPEEDVDGDVGNWCYVTGNGGGGAGNDDLDDGITTLQSPIFDLTDHINPYISYQALFMNAGGNSTPNDELVIRLYNGTDEVVLQTISENTNGWTDVEEFRILDYITTSSNMFFEIETSDLENSGHLVEAGLDNFKIFDEGTLSNDNLEELTLSIAPNPFSEQISVVLPDGLTDGTIEVYDALGRQISSKQVTESQFFLTTDNWASGLYYIIYSNDTTRISHRAIKQ